MAERKTKVASSLEELLNSKDGENDLSKLNFKESEAGEQTSKNGEGTEAEKLNKFFLGASGKKNFEEALYKNELREFICPAPINKIRITRKALSEMFLMAKAINELAYEEMGPNATELEIHCYCIGERAEGPETEPGLITGIFIPTQELSETSVKVSEQGIHEAMLYIKEQNKRILGWSHSHGHFEVYSSETDDVNHEVILNDTNNYVYIKNSTGIFRIKYAYGMTVVEKGEFMGIAISKNSCGALRMEEALFDISGVDYEPFEKQVVLEQIKERIKKVVTVVLGNEDEDGLNEEDMMKTLTEKFLNLFIRTLSTSREITLNSDEIQNDEDMLLVEKILENYDDLNISGAKDSFVSVAQILVENLKKVVRKQKQSEK